MKHLYLLKSTLLLFALVAGSTSLWADKAGFALTAKPFAGSNAISVSGNVTGTQEETWTISLTGSDSSKNPSQSFQKSYYWQIGGNGNQTTAVVSTSGITGYITKIEVDCCAYNSKGTVNVTVGGKAFGGAAQTMPKWNGDSKVPGSESGGVLTFNGGASGEIVVTLAPIADGGRAIYLHSITVTYSDIVPVTISTAEYATFVSSKALDFSTTGVTVYTATAGETSVTLNEVASGKVPANTPVVLYKAGADGTAINVPVIASADAVGSNDLKVSVGGEPTNAYVLANKTSGVGFYKWAGGSLTSGKIYLQGASSAREFLGFGDVTGIESLTSNPSPKGEGSEYYNLAGQRVAQPAKGLYIVNGKKVIIK